MAKGPTISTITAAFASASKLNTNFTDITTSFDNTLSRDGSTPNTMSADFDMNSKDILNTGVVNTDSIILGGELLSLTVAAAAKTHELDTRGTVVAVNISTDFNFIRTSGYTAIGDGGGALYKSVGAEPTDDFKVQSLDGTWWEGVYTGFLTPEMFGAVGDGVTDDSAAAQLMFDYLNGTQKGGRAVFLNKVYLFSSQVTIGGTDMQSRLVVEGYGAVIVTTTAISGLKLTHAGTVGGITINGLKVNHEGNSNATYGFELSGTWNVVLRDCIVETGGNGSTYEGYHLSNSDPADGGTGCFWTTIDKCWVRRRGAAFGTKPPIGIGLWGSSNATTIVNSSILDCVDGIVFGAVAALDARPNGVLISGCDIEGIDDAGILVVDPTFNKCPNGLRIIGNRFESMTYALDLAACSTNPAVSPMLIGNFYLSSVTNFFNNPNTLAITDFEPSQTPLKGVGWRAITTITAINGSTNPLIVKGMGGNRGIELQDSSAVRVMHLFYTGTTGKCGITSGVANGLLLNGVSGISNTLTKAENLRGSETFSTSGTVSVSFGTAESDATYFIFVTGGADENFWITSKGTGGFTINSDNASSTAGVDWLLIR